MVLAQGKWAIPIETPYRQSVPLSIRIESMEPRVPRYGVEEVRLQVGATYDNPFDPADVAVDARVVSPSGASYDVPGFLYRPYTRRLDGQTEKLDPAGAPEWRLRISPTEVGAYTLTVSVKDRTGTSSQDATFDSEPSPSPGFIHVSPRDRRFFEFDNGAPYYPIGANVCWGGDRGTFSYDDWFPAYGAQKCNYARIWLGPSWTTCALEQPGEPKDGKGYGQFDLGNAWRLDRIINEARDNGLYLMLCIDSYNELRSRDAYPTWTTNPANSDNGGPLTVWSQFWSDPVADRFYKNKLRYLVARYGAFTHVLSWEFWNEVDLVSDYDPAPVRGWHQRMGDALKALDPYHHMLTTSLADPMGDRSLQLLPQLDYVQTHYYGGTDLAEAVAYQQSRKGSWGRPHYFGEVGADASGPRIDADPEGMQVHVPMWASLATGASGAAVPWWWDNLIAPKKLYPLFGAVERFTAGIDWPAEGFQQTDVGLAYQQKPHNPPRRDLVFSGGPVYWTPNEANHPSNVSIDGGSASGDLPLSGIQHGIHNHPNLHNPVAFSIHEPRASRFEVEVGDVSGYGGAALRIKLDGDPVLNRTFAGPKTGNATVTRYAGVYAIAVPKGRHTVTVENVGNDWFMVTYRLVGVRPASTPPIDAWAVAGNTTCLVWMRPEGRTWHAIKVLHRNVAPAPPSIIGLTGLASGAWRAEFWEPWSGKVLSQKTVRIPTRGKLRLSVPGFQRDMAVKLVKVGAKHP